MAPSSASQDFSAEFETVGTQHSNPRGLDAQHSLVRRRTYVGTAALGRPSSAARLFLGRRRYSLVFFHHRPNFSPGHPRRNLFPRLHQPSVLHQLSSTIKHQSIPTLQNRQRRQRLQRPSHAFHADLILQQLIPHRGRQSRSPRSQLSANSRQHAPQIVMPHRRSQRFPTTPHQLQRLPLATLQTITKLIHLLLP